MQYVPFRGDLFIYVYIHPSIHGGEESKFEKRPVFAKLLYISFLLLLFALATYVCIRVLVWSILGVHVPLECRRRLDPPPFYRFYHEGD